MELFRLFGKIAIENSEANEAMDETTGKAEQSEGKMTAAFKKIGAAVATFFAVDKIIAFGTACIETAAEVNAMNSQFSQVFGDLEATASKNLSKIADNAGIAENRMKGSYTKIAAFAKTTGMETEDALALADRAMVAVADSAAFYDRTLEETTESLQSFLKGNYENDSALGLSCTETTRNAAANELYGKSFKDLSEEQKQLTLLKMVEDANALSGAIGQAARESDTWTNQTGNLKQAWSDFQAVIGKIALEPATKAVGTLADKLGTVTEKVGAFFEAMSDSETRTKVFSTAIHSLFTDEFLEKVGDFASKWGEMAERMKDSVFSSFSENFTKIQTAAETLWPTLQHLGENGLMFFASELTTLMATIETVVIPIFNLVSTIWTDLATTVYTAVAPAITKISDAFVSMKTAIQEAIQTYIIPVCQSFVEMVQSVYNENQDKITKIGELFSIVFNAIATVFEWFNTNIVQGVFVPAIKAIADFATKNMGTVKNIFQSVFDIIGGIIDFFIALFTGNWQGMWDSVVSILNAAVEIVKNLFNLIFEAISSIMNAIWSKIVEIWESIKLSVSTKLSNIVSAVQEKFTSIKENISLKMEEVKTFLSTTLEAIKTKFSTIWTTIKTTLNTTITTIVTNVKTKFQSIVDGIKEKMELAKTTVSTAIEKIKSFFNFEWKLPDLKLPHISITGEWDLLNGTFPEFGIEWYAKGAVLNQPTIFGMNGNNAMVGGEAGAEAIAPIDVLQKYVAQAVASQNAGLIEILQQILMAIYSMNDGVKEDFIKALESMRFDINGREFARLVKSV